MPTILSFLSGRQVTNDSGVPQAGAKLLHYRETTTTALTVWQNEGGTVAHAQPVVCDAGGFVPLIYVDDTFDWKVIVTTAANVTLKTYDELPKAVTDESALGFAPPLYDWQQVTSASSPVALTAADAGKAYEADTTSGSIEFDLPSAASAGNGKPFLFKKMAAGNSMVIDQAGSETIDDSATALTITRQYQVVEIASNGAEWYVVRQYLEDVVQARLPANTANLVLQVLQNTNVANSDLTAVIPDDDTTPLVSEGTQVLTQAIVLATTSSRVEVHAVIWGATAGTVGISAALFRDSVCIDAKGGANLGSTSDYRELTFHVVDSPATAGSVTYSVRCGPRSADTLRLNGTSAARRFGGNSKCELIVKELAS